MAQGQEDEFDVISHSELLLDERLVIRDRLAAEIERLGDIGERPPGYQKSKHFEFSRTQQFDWVGISGEFEDCYRCCDVRTQVQLAGGDFTNRSRQNLRGAALRHV